MRLANKIAGMPARCVWPRRASTRRCCSAAGLLFEGAQSVYCCGTEDMKEAVRAFFEKRNPSFTAVNVT